MAHALNKNDRFHGRGRRDDLSARAKVIVAAILLLTIYTLVHAQEPAITRLDGSKMTVAQIDATVVQLMETNHVTGAGIAFFNDGKIAFLKSYGFRDKEKSLPLTPHTVIPAESLTKAAFATMVMGLVDQKIIDLDKPVIDYLPKPLPEYAAYRDLAGDARYTNITMRMLLSHSAGFGNWRWFTADQKLRIYFQPGSRFAYSGEGFALAQMIVETVTGKPAQALMNERLFQPLAMTNTSMIWERRFEGDYANGYDKQEKSLGSERHAKAGAGGSMQTTLRDYACFVAAVLNDTIPGGQAHEEMLSPQIRIHSAHELPSLDSQTTTANDALRLSYGLGWGLYWTPFGRGFFKEGYNDGFRHYVVCFDKSKTGILMLTNSSNGDDIFSALLENILGNPFTPLEWEGFKPTVHPDK